LNTESAVTILTLRPRDRCWNATAKAKKMSSTMHAWQSLLPYLHFIFLFIYSCVHALFGSFLHSPPLSHPFPLHPCQFKAGPVLPLSLILLKRRHKHNKEDKAFLLVELRIAIPI
jgi:hypothetical protein